MEREKVAISMDIVRDMILLEHLLSLQFENDNADVVYYTTGSDC